MTLHSDWLTHQPDACFPCQWAMTFIHPAKPGEQALQHASHGKNDDHPEPCAHQNAPNSALVVQGHVFTAGRRENMRIWEYYATPTTNGMIVTWYTVHHADYEFVRKNVHLICRCINLFMRETKCNSYSFTLLGHICQFYGRALRRDPLEHILPFPCTLQAPASALGHCLGIHQS